MRTFIWILTTIVWALWFGGMMTLFAFVTRLFMTDKTVAVQAAPVLFVTFDKLQLVLGAIALAGAVVLGFITRSRVPYLVSFSFVLASLGALLLHAHHIPKMEELRSEGRSDSTEFKQLHGQSSTVFVAEAGLLLIGGIALLTLRDRKSPAI